MGTYLATGIVQKMLIQKREMEKNKFSLENIVKSLQKELHMDNYVLGEDENTIFWEIKPEMLEGNFVEFLEMQFKMYNAEIDIQQMITKVKEAQTGEKIIELAKNMNFPTFQMTDDLTGYSSVRHKDSSFSDHITVNYHMIVFFLDGKIIMECYNNILHYFERNIRLQAKKYPVASCIKTMMTN